MRDSPRSWTPDWLASVDSNAQKWVLAVGGEDAMQVLEYDVVCVGAGGAGVTAAITAASAGARVLLISKEPVGYGDTRIAMGIVATCGVDPDDNAQELYEDLLIGGDHLNNPKMAWAMAEEARLCPSIAESVG